MKTKEQIRHDFEQNHYRKQRELVDAGKLDYWSLSEKNKKGILQQCKDEGKKYRNLSWMATESLSDNDPAVGTSSDMMFHYTEYYYRRLDPLPTEEESEEVAELKQQIENLTKRLEAERADALKKIQGLNVKVSDQEKFLEELLEEKEKEFQRQTNKLEKKLSQQTNLATLATDTAQDRLQELIKQKQENGRLLDELQQKEVLIENYRKEEAALYQDIRTLAMKLA